MKKRAGENEKVRGRQTVTRMRRRKSDQRLKMEKEKAVK